MNEPQADPKIPCLNCRQPEIHRQALCEACVEAVIGDVIGYEAARAMVLEMIANNRAAPGVIEDLIEGIV